MCACVCVLGGVFVNSVHRNMCTSELLPCCQGFLIYLHLSANNYWCVFHADMFHKMSRKCSLAISTSPSGNPFLKKLNRLFRMLRGPFGTAHFGKSLLETRQHLLLQLQSKRSAAIEFAELFLSSIASDYQVDEFSVTDLIETLKGRKGKHCKHVFVLFVISEECPMNSEDPT